VRTDDVLQQRAGLAALAVSIAIFAAVMLQESSQGRGYDFAPLRAAGRLVATGQIDHLYAQDPVAYNLVDDPVFLAAARDAGFIGRPTPFVYPPLVAALMAAMSGISYAAMAWWWGVISVALCLLGVMLARAVYLPRTSLFALAAVLVALCAFEPVLYGFWLGQTTALIFPLVMGALLLQRTGHLAPAGMLLSAAAFIKITPGVLALVWIWRGPRRAAAWFALTLAALWALSIAVMGWDVHAEYVHRVLAAGRAQLVAFNNHSLISFVSRFAFEPSAWLDWRVRTPPRGALVAQWVFLIAITVSAVIVLKRAAAKPDSLREFAEAFAFLSMLLVPNISWTHYFVFLLPVIAIVLARRAPGFMAPVVLAGVAFVLCCRPFLLPQKYIPSTVQSAFAISLPTIAALALVGALLLVASRTAPARSTS
jgi:hypothetical protein